MKELKNLDCNQKKIIVRVDLNVPVFEDKITDYYKLNIFLKQDNPNLTVIDARPESRFLKIEPEPRKNIGKGNIIYINKSVWALEIIKKNIHNQIEKKKSLIPKS